LYLNSYTDLFTLSVQDYTFTQYSPPVNFCIESRCLKPSLDSVTFHFGIAMQVHLEKTINLLCWNFKVPQNNNMKTVKI